MSTSANPSPPPAPTTVAGDVHITIGPDHLPGPLQHAEPITTATTIITTTTPDPDPDPTPSSPRAALSRALQSLPAPVRLALQELLAPLLRVLRTLRRGRGTTTDVALCIVLILGGVVCSAAWLDFLSSAVLHLAPVLGMFVLAVGLTVMVPMALYAVVVVDERWLSRWEGEQGETEV